MKLILPKTHVFPDRSMPFFFLAGPIRGGGDWQTRIMESLLRTVGNDFTIANPSRYPLNHPAHHLRESGDETYFKRQLEWERFYLEYAAKYAPCGAILFWLGREDREKPRTEDLPYARDTYGELGEWRGRMMHDPSLRVLIGADPDFPGLDVIHRCYKAAIDPGFLISVSIDELAERAAELVKR
jgi:hypothetical protein